MSNTPPTGTSGTATTGTPKVISWKRLIGSLAALATIAGTIVVLTTHGCGKGKEEAAAPGSAPTASASVVASAPPPATAASAPCGGACAAGTFCDGTKCQAQTVVNIPPIPSSFTICNSCGTSAPSPTAAPVATATVPRRHAPAPPPQPEKKECTTGCSPDRAMIAARMRN